MSADSGEFPSPVRASLTGLPSDVLRDASRRLGWVALVYSGTYFLAFFAVHFAFTRFSGMEASLLDRPVPFAAATVSIALGLGVFALSRWGRVEARRLLDLGLVFEVVGALGIAVAEFWGSDIGSGVETFVGLSWTCIWILMFPVIAPNTPIRILIASLLAASMAPLVLFTSLALGYSAGTGATVVELLLYFVFTTYLCAGISYLLARVIYRFGVKLKEAREVGSYRLVDKLGTGGMGEVWLAEHRLLARPAAVKLIRPRLVGAGPGERETMLRRFEREARATSRLRSVHTVELYDFGATDEGVFYYVMELLEGVNLSVLVERFGPVPAGRVIYLLRQVCLSLAEAHESGMIHRDIKPANIFTCRMGTEFDFVKVLDFGLVKHTPAPGSEDLGLTGRGSITGTPAFMAPEMALTEGAVDWRADLYAVGCVAYWLLTGQKPFEADTAMAMVLEHLRTPPVPPSARADREVPAELEALVLRCLEKEPGDRPGSALELEAALADCRDFDPWGPPEAGSWWKRHLPPTGTGGPSPSV